jgi:hypothetical protein
MELPTARGTDEMAEDKFATQSPCQLEKDPDHEKPSPFLHLHPTTLTGFIARIFAFWRRNWCPLLIPGLLSVLPDDFAQRFHMPTPSSFL